MYPATLACVLLTFLMFNGENAGGVGVAISKIAFCWASVVSAHINGINHKKHTEETGNTSVLHCPQVLIQWLIHQFHISSFCLILSRDILVKIRPLYLCFYLLFLFFPIFYLLSHSSTLLPPHQYLSCSFLPFQISHTKK